jgi:hypothetical protein
MTSKKTFLSCAAAAALAIVVPLAFFLWFAHGLETAPLKGWQEEPHVSPTPPAVHLTPEP